jgi:hypothetical protein
LLFLTKLPNWNKPFAVIRGKDDVVRLALVSILRADTFD